MSRRARSLLHAAGLLACLAAFGAGCLGDLAAHVPAWLVAYGVGLVPLVVVGAAAHRGRGLGAHGRRDTLLIVVAWALVMRGLLLVLTEPTLSDDVFRYVWEGRLVAAGLDPFDRAPDAASLTRLALDAPEWSSINHRELPAIYPPGAQWIFGAIARVSPTVWAFRVAMVCFDLAVILTLGALLRVAGRDPRWLVLYAWHPLVAVEVASSGHYEPMALLPLLAGLLAWQSPRRGSVQWLLWGVAIATKYVGGAAAWFAARRLIAAGQPGAAFLGLVTAALAALLLAAPFALDGTPPVGSLGTYVEHWGHNGSVHALLTGMIGYHPARKAVAALFLVWALWLTWRAPSPARGFLLLFGGLVVLSPVVHPWYGLWIIALLPLVGSPSLIALSALLPLSYLAWTQQAAGGAWAPPAWVPWLEYGVPFVLAVGLSPRRGDR